MTGGIEGAEKGKINGRNSHNDTIKKREGKKIRTKKRKDTYIRSQSLRGGQHPPYEGKTTVVPKGKGGIFAILKRVMSMKRKDKYYG